MQKTVEQQIRAKITHARYGAVFFVSTFPQFDVEYKIKNRIYGNAANQILRSSIDDNAKLAIISDSTK